MRKEKKRKTILEKRELKKKMEETIAVKKQEKEH